MAGSLNPINFRLRRYKDEDLINEFNKLDPKTDKADLIRAALRAYFNPGNIVRPLEGVKRHSAPVCELQGDIMSGLDLVKTEKSDNQIGDALDDLLGKF